MVAHLALYKKRDQRSEARFGSLYCLQKRHGSSSKPEDECEVGYGVQEGHGNKGPNVLWSRRRRACIGARGGPRVIVTGMDAGYGMEYFEHPYTKFNLL